jgi:hypothetical protein
METVGCGEDVAFILIPKSPSDALLVFGAFGATLVGARGRRGTDAVLLV